MDKNSNQTNSEMLKCWQNDSAKLKLGEIGSIGSGLLHLHMMMLHIFSLPSKGDPITSFQSSHLLEPLLKVSNNQTPAENVTTRSQKGFEPTPSPSLIFSDGCKLLLLFLFFLHSWVPCPDSISSPTPSASAIFGELECLRNSSHKQMALTLHHEDSA